MSSGQFTIGASTRLANATPIPIPIAIDDQTQ
jgi:hypothetical protein